MGLRLPTERGGAFLARAAQKGWFSSCWHRGLPSTLKEEGGGRELGWLLEREIVLGLTERERGGSTKH